MSLDTPCSPRFWRDDRLPFVEVRSIADGRKVTYTRHAHEHFSIGLLAPSLMGRVTTCMARIPFGSMQARWC
ncbi:MAG: hypothetical protein GAK32_00424 [Pseudomonas fluorescens]|nr:MAG: hypothetical protein GAK32_00424 [Pseudomonas fluorescens]